MDWKAAYTSSVDMPASDEVACGLSNSAISLLCKDSPPAAVLAAGAPPVYAPMFAVGVCVARPP